jgi:primosomal protein N'
VELAAWVADYYACGVGEAIATAMPPRAWIESERHARSRTRGGAAAARARRAARRARAADGRTRRVGRRAARSAKGGRRSSRALEADGLITLTRPLKGTADASRTIASRC